MGIFFLILQHTATTHYNTLQHTATHCTRERQNTCVGNVLSLKCLVTATHCNNSLQHTATHCSTLQHTATRCTRERQNTCVGNVLSLQHTATTRCNTLQHTATHHNTLQHIATHCNILQHTAESHCNTLPRTATHRNTLHTSHRHNHTRPPRIALNTQPLHFAKILNRLRRFAARRGFWRLFNYSSITRVSNITHIFLKNRMYIPHLVPRYKFKYRFWLNLIVHRGI